ncbi:MAG TPA: adenylate/guanylate cyclase domain-containing protein [Candidatus Udaeobacter sp.]|nr:adenylate/guanylate cyclase domain-containing protein [Candidatus Udaeobacter sp.]
MSAKAEQRKLAAIMFTDMVGYSALSQRDDKLALELLEEHRRLLREIFPRFNGAEIKTIGDAFLIEFNSALEAAQCAIEIQRTLAKRNHDVTAERRIELKIGIHIGDVVHRGGDVYGDGVNIASRIEALAGAGGICVSMDVERQIRNALEARFEKLAPTDLKNISVAMDLFRIVLPWEPGAKAERKNAETRVSGRSFPASRLVWVGAIVLAFIGFGSWWSDRQSGKATKSSNMPSTAPAADQKSIAVLPFVDMSQAKDQEYFCDGMSEEILDALAKVDGLRVVARTSSFSFKGKNADVGDVAKKLNVGNILEGSLRREGNRIRITAQLINARDGFHLWSDTYERELKDVFAVQDEITRSIVDALKIKLAVAPPARARQNTEAYDLYLQGLYLSNKSDEENLRKSLIFFQRALDKDPNFARAWIGIAKAWIWLADAYVRPLEAYAKVKEAASKALALDERNADAHCYLGETKRILDRNLSGEEEELKRAMEIDPNSTDAHLFMSFLKSAQGELEEAVQEIEEAERLDPLSPPICFVAVLWYRSADRIEDAINAGQRSVQLDPNYVYFDPPLADAYRAKGDFNQALALYEKAQAQTHFPSPGLGITYAKMGRRDDARRIVDQLIEKSRQQYVAADSIAAVYLALGEKDEALRWLERAFEEHSGSFYSYMFRPEFRALRSDPRFADLLRRTGIDSAKVPNPQKNL